MKTTVTILAGWITVVICLSVSVAEAREPLGTTPPPTGRAGVAQAAAPATQPKGARSESDNLLQRARQAMAEDDLQTADTLISQAEALGVKYGFLSMGDNPKRARRDLEKKRRAAAKSPRLPSQLFSPFAPKKAPGANPFAGRSSEQLLNQLGNHAAGNNTPGPAAESRLPDPGRINPMTLPERVSPLSKSPHAAPPMPQLPPEQRINELFGAVKKPAAGNGAAAHRNGPDNPLLEARRALAVGDVRRATAFLERAKTAAPQVLGPLDDSPEKVEAAVRKYQEVSAQPRTTDAYRRGYARMLMEQSEALLRAGDHDMAERLADQAARERVTYGHYEATPNRLLERISAERRRSAGPAKPLSPVQIAANMAGAPMPSLAARQKANYLTQQARAALRGGDLRRAESLARQAEQLGIPDSAYAPGEDRPGIVLFDIRKAQRVNNSTVVPTAAHSVAPATGPLPARNVASRAVYNPANDPTRNVRAQHQQPTPPETPRRLDLGTAPMTPAPVARPTPAAPPAGQPAGPGMALFQQGEAALKDHDKDRAYKLFRQAATRMNELDPYTAQRLQSYLQLLQAPRNSQAQPAPSGSLADEALKRQQDLARQVSVNLAVQQGRARSMRESDAKGALALLEEVRKQVEASGLDMVNRERLLQRVDRELAETRQFIETNKPLIELGERNQRTREEIEREKRLKLEIQEKLAQIVDDFNKKMDEQRYAEAEVVAKRAAELDPENALIKQLLWQAKFVRRFQSNERLRSEKEASFWDTMHAVDESSVPFDDRFPIRFPDIKDWQELTDVRARMLRERRGRLSEQEMEIERKLRTPVSLDFKNAPLSVVLDHLARLCQVNLYLDPQGLAEEGVSTDEPISIEVRQEIMLKSALNLILQPLRLSYVIKDEVLKITSEQRREGDVYTITYPVADLVVPIPNFVPTPRMGLAGAYNDALGMIGFGGGGGMGLANTPLAVVASKNGSGNAGAINPALLAQVQGGQSQSGGISPTPTGFGPGGLGGGANADFDSLIELITSTIKPETWDEVGGPGSIKEFQTNLSIVVSQTQDVHEEIVDLLEQLRRLQDLQVTIEVRFITLNDNFFERIGVDFDFDINDNIDRPFQVFGRRDPNISTAYMTELNANSDYPRNVLDQDRDTSVTVGMTAPGVFSADLDIPFVQNSFGLAVPQFGGFDASAGAQLGFAILSDIEAFLFINAAHGDRRSNVLQAPKVTLFNGQMAYVSDTSQSPFVISVIPVVGDFAAAQQPVIVVLSEGTFMTVQAVASADRRFVRLTVVPFFSRIGDVETFQFTGSETTTQDVSANNIAEDRNADFPDGVDTDNSTTDNSTTTRSGTTVQLPTFSFVTVTTTVSVPDGGTVLLGGIKRLSEGRNEFGVPMLDKIPYLNRLFKNVGIGRETQSLMMMVTPRIIIQEEEEERLGILPPT